MKPAEPTSGVMAFRPRARLLKLIGSELISDDVVAVTELVKNAHDADASHVTIRFEAMGGPDARIVVSDDGHGMDRESLLGGWMEPAGSTKRGPGLRRTPRGRWVLGEKGLGRFAADKLGAGLELISRRAGNAAEVRAEFDWDSFDDDTALLGDVTSRWEIRPATDIERQGTILRITRLRSAWTERMFRRLCTRLSRLRSPFAQGDDFRITIDSDDFPDYSGDVEAGYLDQAPYRLRASFDGTSHVTVAFNGQDQRVLPWTAVPLACGPVEVRLHAFDLETEAMSRIGPRQEVRGWLREWCGISIYRDGFRVWPYGEPHDDWLRLDQRRVNNPVVCLSNNQVVGFVSISEQANPELRDQTNREGLVHTPALDDLRRLMHFVLGHLENERQKLRHPQKRRGSAPAALKTETDGELASLRAIAAGIDGRMGARLRGIASRLEEARDKERLERKRLVDAYAELAGRGQVVSTVGAGLTDVARRFEFSLRNVTRSGDGGYAARVLGKTAGELLEHLALIQALGGGANRRRAIDIADELDRFVELYRPQAEAAGVSLKAPSGRVALLRTEMSPESFRLVLHALFTNSIDCLDTVAHPRIQLSVKRADHVCEVRLGDNGPGFPKGCGEKIFEPTVTFKEGGRGMGLTIARQLAESVGGSLQAESGRRRGATFLLRLPLKRSRST